MKKIILLGGMILGMSVLVACGGDNDQSTETSTQYQYPAAEAEEMPYAQYDYYEERDGKDAQ